jgi:hypothetical protein
MAQGIDFTALIKGQQLADQSNWSNIRRIQEQDQYAITREQQLAKQMDERQKREATQYLSTILPNLQRYADQGLNPVDALLNQRTAIMNDTSGYGAMSPQTQTQIINGLGDTARLQMAALAKAGKWDEVQRLTAAFGGINPVNPLGPAIASGDPLAVFNAVNVQSPGAFTLTPDQKFVVDRAGNQVPLNDWVANIAAGAGRDNSVAGSYGAFYQQGQQDRAQTAAEQLQKQQETANALNAIKLGVYTTEQIKAAYPNADPAIFGGAMPIIPQGQTATPATAEQVAALSTPLVPGAATPAATVLPGVTATPSPGGNPAIMQLVSQIQAANEPQLSSMQQTLQQQLVAGKSKVDALNAYAKPLEDRQAAIQNLLNQNANPRSGVAMLPAERQQLEAELVQIAQHIAETKAASAPLATSLRDMVKVFNEIAAQRQRLKLPQYDAVPDVSMPNWAAQMLKRTQP